VAIVILLKDEPFDILKCGVCIFA